MRLFKRFSARKIATRTLSRFPHDLDARVVEHRACARPHERVVIYDKHADWLGLFTAGSMDPRIFRSVGDGLASFYLGTLVQGQAINSR